MSLLPRLTRRSGEGLEARRQWTLVHPVHPAEGSRAEAGTTSERLGRVARKPSVVREGSRGRRGVRAEGMAWQDRVGGGGPPGGPVCTPSLGGPAESLGSPWGFRAPPPAPPHPPSATVLPCEPSPGRVMRWPTPVTGGPDAANPLLIILFWRRRMPPACPQPLRTARPGRQ